MEQRIPPQNVEAEQAVLGAMLIEHNAVITALERLSIDDFYRDTHRIIFEAMEHLYRENKEIDVITLPEELRRMKKLEEAGGLEYLLSLPNLVATAANIEYHAGIVAEKALARNLIRTCTDVAAEAYDGEKIQKRFSTMRNDKFFILPTAASAVTSLLSARLSTKLSIRSLNFMKIKKVLRGYRRDFAILTG